MEQLDSLADLLDLQAVDLEIDRLLQRRQSLPELEDYRLANEEARRLRGEIEALQTLLRDERLELDKMEGELGLLEQKVEVEERRLFAGGLSARETEYLRQEVESLKRRISEMEDTVLEHLDRRQDLEGRLAGLQEQLVEVERRVQELDDVISAAWQEIDADLARREERKGDIVPLIPSALLELYEELRQTKEGVAVGRMAEGVCGGCHLRLSAAERAQVVKEWPPRCLHCRRILVVQ